MISVIRKRLKLSLFDLIGPLIILGCKFLGVTVFLQSEGFKLANFPLADYISRCSTVEFQDQGRQYVLGTCVIFKRDFDSQFLNFVVDTSKQIGKPPNEHSENWKEASRSLAYYYIENEYFNVPVQKIAKSVFVVYEEY